MADQILHTKLYIPSLRPQLVPRPRLLAQLNHGLQYKLTLISAPAGFGKTTVICDWLRTTELPVAWLALDEGDNDLLRFLAYVIAALQRVVPTVGQTVQAMMQSPQPPATTAWMTTLINEVTTVAPKFIF
ncbi:MAG: hypothetical protein KDE58_15325, partial [Caldilineaceae bacterium]|nr:hypothetical protein [Caldilineaceae bacterium]